MQKVLRYQEGMNKYMGTCENCYIAKGLKRTVTRWQKLPCSEVDHDLSILSNQWIDFDRAEEAANEDVKMNYKTDSYIQTTQDKIAWAKQKIDRSDKKIIL
jgi:hypothetical protein